MSVAISPQSYTTLWDTIIEHLIQLGETHEAEARKALRYFLYGQLGNQPDGSIGEALAALARQPVKNSLAATVILRCLAVRGLVPESNQANQISRSVVELCEGAVPELLTFLKFDRRAQNFEKFAALSTFHSKMSELLGPLRNSYGDMDSIIAARKELLGILNHSIIRKYCDYFRLNEIKSTIEALFGKMRQVASLSVTLLSDIDDFNRTIESALVDFQESKSFLSEEYLKPFVNSCRFVLDDFIRTQRAKFATKIVWGRGTNRELQKRYPLHEAEREMQILLPLRNIGPGLATDLRVTVTSEGGQVVLGGETVMLGNVLPGDFSVAIDVMIISPCQSFQGLLQVEWGEIGKATRDSEIFEFSVVSQRGDIDWQSLEYRSPYTTGVAEGDEFHGRADKVRQLGARLLRQPMEPFYITGQKRVGKTSLALASVKYASDHSSINTLHYHYILWGDIAHADPNAALRNLGESIEEFILDRLPSAVHPAKGDFTGSLSGLIKLASVARSVNSSARFVILIDEFDEIHQELFLHGPLAETFFCKSPCSVAI